MSSFISIYIMKNFKQLYLHNLTPYLTEVLLDDIV